MELVLYALRDPQGGGFLASPARGCDFASVRPQSWVVPRLFKSPDVAELAASVWRRANPNGQIEVTPMTLKPKDFQ